MPDSFQAIFHAKWGHLRDRHVRSLAWLIDSPDLLDPAAACWQGKIASLGPAAGTRAAAWLADLDRDPHALHDWLDLRPFSRLGRYAEKLLSFYFTHTGYLLAHGVQVRNDKGETHGEFDFLLRREGAFEHWEFATKFYLLHSDATWNGRGVGTDAPLKIAGPADYFVGPNLADTLGRKMVKILDRQLALSDHPAAQIHLPEPVAAARALVKGWLFYPASESQAPHCAGVSPDHCRGFWGEVDTLDGFGESRFAVLPRLHWMPPALVPQAQTLDRSALLGHLATHFESDTMPVLVAVLDGEDAGPEGGLRERDRGFIVSADWRERARLRIDD